MEETRFSFVRLLSAWFFRRDEDITLKSGKTLNLNGGDLDLGSGDLITSGTVDGVDVSGLNTSYAAHVADTNIHHNRSHDLDSSSDHSGTLGWAKVNKSGSNLDDLATKNHGDLDGITANDHHNRSHDLDSSSDHSGTLGWAKVNKSGSNLDDLATKNHGDLDGITANDHHNRSHDLDSSSDHSGTLGWAKVNKSGSNLDDLATKNHGDLDGLTSGDPHTQYHNDSRGDGRYYQKTEFSTNPGASAKPLITDSGGAVAVQYLLAKAGIRIGTTSSYTADNTLLVEARGSHPSSPGGDSFYLYKYNNKAYIKFDNGTVVEIASE